MWRLLRFVLGAIGLIVAVLVVLDTALLANLFRKRE